MPWPSSLPTAVRISPPTPSVKPVWSMYPVVSSIIPANSMSGMRILSLTTLTSTVSPLCTFFTEKVTLVPGSPFILSLHCWEVRPWTVSPSMLSISSPHLSPYFDAGEPA